MKINEAILLSREDKIFKLSDMFSCHNFNLYDNHEISWEQLEKYNIDDDEFLHNLDEDELNELYEFHFEI